MIKNDNQTILVVNDVEATRKSIEVLLKQDGYNIKTARDEQNAADAARAKQPDLMLVSLDGETDEVVASVRRIRRRAALDENIPVIIFCADEFEENEVSVERNIFLSCPDNFNQLRNFISRLLLQSQKATQI
jgi:DNA-binding response OmpR family regulator